MRPSPRHVPALLCCALLAAPAEGQSQDPIDKFWVADGGVAAIEDDATRVYLGGKFSRVAPRTGSSVRIDAVTGLTAAPFPHVRGVVNAVTPDGAGGWFLGGAFDRVGDRFRSNLAHVLADGRVSDWECHLPGPVFALAREPGWLYVGGTFGTVCGGFPRNNLARVSTSFGSGDPTWDPNVGGPVYALVLRQGLLYVGGAFNTVNGLAPRNNAAAVSTSNGVATPWHPNVNIGVRAIAVPAGPSTDVYLGGAFTLVNGGSPVARLAKFDAAGVADLSWTPNPSDDVLAIAVPGGGGVVYVGGEFLNAGGQPRAHIAAIDAGGNAIASWNPGANDAVHALALRGFQLFMGGRFTQVAGQPRNHLALVDDPGGTLLPWDPHAFADVFALAFEARPAGPDWVYAGGNFAAVNGAARSNLAALLKSTGEVDASWLAEPDGGVHALRRDGLALYVGGEFLNVGGQPRRRLAALTTLSGGAFPWNPDIDAGAGLPSVRALAIDTGAGRVYAGGSFTLVNGTLGRLNAAAFDISTGAATAWDPRPDSLVRQIDVVPGIKAELAGDFVQLNSPPVTRPHFAAVDLGSGIAAGFSANPNAPVHAFFTRGADLHLAGVFSLLGTPAATRNRAGAVNGTGGVTVWNPNVSGPLVRALVQDSATSAMLGGDFADVGGFTRHSLAQVDLASGLPTAWNPDVTGGAVAAILPRPPMVFTGGDFTFVNARPQQGFAAFCKAAAVTGVTAAPVGPNSIRVNWLDNGAPSYNVYRAELGQPYQFVGSGSSGAVGLIDFDAEGGVSYAYVVRAEQGDCESDASAPPAFAVTTGPCGLAPRFDGAADAAQVAGSACRVQVLWGNAVGRCGESPTFSVYRSTSPTFVPDGDNRFAHGISGFGWLDAIDLAPNTTYYYIVRAFDTGNGEEDTNLIRVSATTPLGCIGGAPPTVDVLTARSRVGENRLEWVDPLGFSTVHLRFNVSPAPNTPCVLPTGPADGAPVPGSPFTGTPGDADSTDHTGLSDGHNYCYAAFVQGAAFSDASPAEGRPASAPAAVQWSYSTAAAALSRPAVVPEGAYYDISNDRLLHAQAPGLAGGAWPSTPAQWKPQALDATALGRPTVVELPTTTVGGASRIALVGAQDGRVYCFNARTGALLWVSNGGVPLGDGIATPPSVMVQDFGITPGNFVLVGTRNTTSDNRLVALHLSSGAVAWSFDHGGGPNGIGLINGQVLVEYGAAPRVYFASRRRAGGSADTLWAVNVGVSTGTHAWSAPVGEVDGAVTRRAGTLYVGNNAGEVWSLSSLSGAINWNLSLGDGPVKGFVWPDAFSARLYVSTSTKVHALTDMGVSAVPFWTPALPAPNPSTPVLVNGVLYFGGSSGLLHAVLAGIGGPPPTPSVVVLGDPSVPKVVGTPTFDRGSPTTGADDILVVGTDEGRIYAVHPPF